MVRNFNKHKVSNIGTELNSRNKNKNKKYFGIENRNGNGMEKR